MFRQISLMRAVSRLAPLCYKAARFVKLYADVRRFSARGDSRDVAERGAGALKFRHHGGARRVPPRARAFAPEVLVLENYENLARFSKERLIELVGIYAKNWLAMDGVWFQSVERRDGMEAAMYHDAEAWRRFTVIEAKRIKEFLRLRDSSPVFDDARRHGRAGIPCFVLDDGRVTLVPEEAGLKSRDAAPDSFSRGSVPADLQSPVLPDLKSGSSGPAPSDYQSGSSCSLDGNGC